MVNAWRMAEGVRDQHEENQRQPPCPVSVDDLKKLLVFCEKVFRFLDILRNQITGELDPQDSEGLEHFKRREEYDYQDRIVVARDVTPEYDKKVKMFFQEHIHADPEVRFIVGGSGYFDVRDEADEWVRIEVRAGDLLVIPAGIYHRFTTDQNDFVEAIRLFKGEPVWTPHNRPADEHPVRAQYLKLREIWKP